MTSPLPILILTVEEYLESEKFSPVRREYLAGHVYAMTGTSAAHNLIALNIASRLRAHLRGGPCQTFISDMKLRIESINTFYYPDVMVTCDPEDSGDYFKTRPTLSIEVSSPSTVMIDRREKLLAYQKIASLREYVLVSQDEIKIEVYQRVQNGRWWEHTLEREGELQLESVGLKIDVSEVYEDVRL
jgi:Uma2 family endonuclease